MFEVSNKNTQKSYEPGSKFKAKMPVKNQICCLLLIINFNRFYILFLLIACDFVDVEFTEYQLTKLPLKELAILTKTVKDAGLEQVSYI